MKRASRQLRRDEIESAAMRSILKHGFPECSLRTVAKEAGLPLSILHYYYRDKNELMAHAARRIFDAPWPSSRTSRVGSASRRGAPPS